ncbi:HAD family hydrolase [Gordonia hongkongensis]|uniref:HAD family hydrolase n=1 Tax=Gordonia hongkongensis TaxID=1701090 RepID=UPI003EB6AB44
MPDAVLFDFDGTLADTTERWHSAYEACLTARGRRLDEAMRHLLAGASVSDAAARLSISRREVDEALLEAFTARPVVAMPGATELVVELAGVTRLAVASNGPEALVRIGLAQLGIAGCVDAVVSAETADVYKPLPDVFLRAAAAVGTSPENCVAVEDSMVGGQAAVAAGTQVIFVSADGPSPIGIALRVRRLDDPRVREWLGAPPARAQTVAVDDMSSTGHVAAAGWRADSGGASAGTPGGGRR